MIVLVQQAYCILFILICLNTGTYPISILYISFKVLNSVSGSWSCSQRLGIAVKSPVCHLIMHDFLTGRLQLPKLDIVNQELNPPHKVTFGTYPSRWFPFAGKNRSKKTPSFKLLLSLLSFTAQYAKLCFISVLNKTRNKWMNFAFGGLLWSMLHLNAGR